MSPFLKLGIGAVLLGVGFVVSMKGQRELIARFQVDICEDREDETDEAESPSSTPTPNDEDEVEE